MEIASRLKCLVREHPRSRRPYAFLADKWTRAKIAIHAVSGCRYHTAMRFDRLFRATRDPWNYESCPLSERRLQLILHTLPKRRYARLFEVGCAEGWMTPLLAARADQLISADISLVALSRAEARCRRLSNVHFIQTDLQRSSTNGPFDGIVCAGVLVFLPMESQQKVCNQLVAAIEHDGHLLLEHTRESYPGEIAGNTIHKLYRTHPQLVEISHLEVDNYAITLLRKTGL
jgi:2-polyprenyl-3-methyl-5-hydroxy-6-metoxy-1,4-benzoquinol methylase